MTTVSFRVHARLCEENKFMEGEWNRRERGHIWVGAVGMATRTEFVRSLCAYLQRLSQRLFHGAYAPPRR